MGDKGSKKGFRFRIEVLGSGIVGHCNTTKARSLIIENYTHNNMLVQKVVRRRSRVQ